MRGGAAAGTADMVRAASRLRDRLEAAAGPGIEVSLTGSAGLWSEFNEENKAAMLRSEVLSWPVTLAVLAVAFGSLAAAGIPLLLAILGLVATAGALWIGAQFTGITIWAMNFALMFALAVGIDYALFVVVRFRAALRAGLRPDDAVAETMDSAGRAVLVSGVAVLAALAARHGRAESAVPHERARDPARRGVRARGVADPPAGAAGAPRHAHRPLRAALGGCRAAPQRGVRALGTADLAPPGRDRRTRARGARRARRRGARPAHGDADDRRPARRRERARRLRAPPAGLRRAGHPPSCRSWRRRASPGACARRSATPPASLPRRRRSGGAASR